MGRRKESKGLIKNLRFRSEENVYTLKVKESWFAILTLLE